MRRSVLIASIALPLLVPSAGQAKRKASHPHRRAAHHHRHRARHRPAGGTRSLPTQTAQPTVRPQAAGPPAGQTSPSPTATQTAPPPATPTTRSAVDALRYDYTVPQLDALFSSLLAGPMPGNTTARGWVRCRLPGCENRQGNALLNDPLVPFLWKGQVWQTDQNGGTLINRTLNDSRRDFPAVVSYGPAIQDGRPAIEVAYPKDTNPIGVDRLYLDCRAFQTGVYLCYVWLENPLNEDQKVLLFNVIEDTLDPN